MECQLSRLAPLRSYAQRQLEQQQFAGVAWSIEHKGEVIEQACLGCRDAAGEQALTEETIYRLYSMTKPVVSVLALQLIEAGLLQLDSSINRWLPEFRHQQVLDSQGQLTPRQRSITIEDLLTHRSGLSYDFLPDCPVADQYRTAQLADDGSRSLQELSEQLARVPLAFQPGERWYYSYSTDVLASVIERVCDKSLAQCLSDALFKPLGMGETGFQVAQEDLHRLAQMFGQRALGEVSVGAGGSHPPGNQLRAMDIDGSYPAQSSDFARGGIGLYSTLSDYRRFMGVLMHGRSPAGECILSQPMLDLCWQNRLSDAQMPITIGDKAYPGYGWGLTGRVLQDTSTAMRLSAAGEGGWAGAASTYFWVDRKNQFSGMIMAQYLGSEITLGPDMQALAYAALS